MIDVIRNHKYVLRGTISRAFVDELLANKDRVSRILITYHQISTYMYITHGSSYSRRLSRRENHRIHIYYVISITYVFVTSLRIIHKIRFLRAHQSCSFYETLKRNKEKIGDSEVTFLYKLFYAQILIRSARRKVKKSYVFSIFLTRFRINFKENMTKCSLLHFRLRIRYLFSVSRPYCKNGSWIFSRRSISP